MSIKLSELTKSLQIEHDSHTPEVMTGHIDSWYRILSLASFARALDNSLPPNIACFKIADTENPLDTPFEIYFTDSTNKIFDKEALDSSNSVPFFEALKNTIPSFIIGPELNSLTLGSPMNFKNTTDAAIYTAFKEMELKIASFKDFIEDEDGETIPVKQVSTNVIPIPQDYYINNRSFAQQVIFSEPSNNENREYLTLNKNRSIVKQIKSILSKPFSEASEADKQFIIDGISSLNGRYADDKFEEKYNISFISYAMVNNKKAIDWTRFLHDEAGCSVKISHGYDNNLNSAALAIANNDIESLSYLIDNGVSVATRYHSIPEVISSESHEVWFRSCVDKSLPLISWAAIAGSSDCVTLLLEKGCDPDIATERNMTAAHFASLNNDLQSIKALSAYNARFDIETVDSHKIASELADETPEGDLIFETIENWRQGSVPRPDKDSVATPLKEKETLNKVIPNKEQLIAKIGKTQEEQISSKKSLKIK